MAHDPRALLWDAIAAGETIERFLSGKGYHDYVADELLRSAVERQFEILGEALSQLGKKAPEFVARVPQASKAIGFRNVLIHGYAMVDDAIAWQAASRNLPSRLSSLREILAEASSESAKPKGHD